MAHLDFKVTTWKRIHIPDNKVQEVIEELKNKTPGEGPYDLLEQEGFYEDNSIEDFEEPMTTDENEGASTQELYNSEGQLIYQNGADY